MVESEGNGWVGSDGGGGVEEGEWWRGEGGRAVEGGRDGGGREWCEVRSEEKQKRTYQSSSSLVSAHGCWPSLSGRSSSFACG